MTNGGNNGPIAAAMLAGGIGCFFLGLMTDLSEVSEAIKSILSFSNAVGPLSGKTVVAVVCWLISWAILAVKWREQTVDFGKIFRITLVLVALSAVMTFPMFYGLL